jgi:hypothetical protein
MKCTTHYFRIDYFDCLIIRGVCHTLGFWEIERCFIGPIGITNLKKVEGNTRRIKSASQKAILLHMAEKLDRIRSYTYQKGIYLWFGAPKWIRALNINGETYMKCWEEGHAEKHTICWKACFVVTLSCLFFLMEMVKLKCWEAGHAEKHKICWKACFVVKCLFFYGNGET